MTIDLTPEELREFARLAPGGELEQREIDMIESLAVRIEGDPWEETAEVVLALALADAMERVEQLTNEARLANNAVGSHANEIVMLSAKINDLKTVLKRAYAAMAEPYGDWKDIREAKSLIEIRAMLGGDPT